jgi:hypothetical protein
MLNFGLDYLGKILTLLGIRISTVLKPPYLKILIRPPLLDGGSICLRFDISAGPLMAIQSLNEECHTKHTSFLSSN